METNVNYAVVGTFIISLTAVIVLSIIWLSSGFTYGQYTDYRVYMEESVSGLTMDSAVEYNGVNVGTVTQMDLDPNNPQLVRLLLSIKKSTPVTFGTEAILNVKGLTGVAFMMLRDKGRDPRPLKVEKGQPYPVIKTSPSFFLRLEDAVTKVTDSVKDVTKSIRTLLDQENLRSFKEILVNLRDISDTLSKTRNNFGAILNNTARASKDFPDVVNQLNQQTLPRANAAAINLDTTMENLSRFSRELKQNPSVIIRGRTAPKAGPGE